MTICWTLFEAKLKNKMNIVISFKKTLKFSMENNMVHMLITNVHEYVQKKIKVHTCWDGQKLNFDFRWHDE